VAASRRTVLDGLDFSGNERRPALLAATAADEKYAARLARRLGLRHLATGTDPASCTQAEILLVVSDRALCLQQTGKDAPGAISVDFGSAALRYRRRSGTTELLGRAVGHHPKRPLTILDATAGLGRDAFILAGLGNEVRLCERDPVVVELLRAGLAGASRRLDSGLREVALRMSLHPGDARDQGGSLLSGVDVVYLDPMFPVRAKSAAVKKEMALLQRMLGESSTPGESDSLLRWALEQGAARVVVKRPAAAASLAGPRPSHGIEGKSIRYDVYVDRKIR
jgi:16S rRNA (guanine1516-N2)-methyltransferase